MTVIRPNSVSGITSITAQANEINFFRSNGTLAGLNLNGVNFNTTSGISTFAALNIEGVLTYQDVTNVDSIGLITARSGINVTGGQLDVGSNIKIGNAGVITATTFVGALTGNAASSDTIDVTGKNDNVTYYPTFVDNTGSGKDLHIDNGGSLNYNPSTNVLSSGTFSGSGANLTNLPAANLTGTLPAISGANLTNLPPSAPVGGASTNQVFFENDKLVEVNYQITSTKNAMSAGPISISAGIAVTVPSGCSWTIV